MAPLPPRLARAGRLLFRGYIVFAVLLTLWSAFVAFTPIVPWYAGKVLAGDWTDSDGDILIVLGAEANTDGLIGYASYWRCIYAVRAWRQGHFRRVVLCGGPAGLQPRPTISGSMRDFLVSSGVPRDVIFLEEQSRSTRENAVNATQLVAGWPGKKVLLTSDLHMFRAYRVFRAAGLDVVPRPIPDAVKNSQSFRGRWSNSWVLAVETVKIAYYAARGWI